MSALIAERLRRTSLVGAISALAAGLGALVILSWLVVALVHSDDTYHMSHSSGVLTALARYADHGTLYPPLYDDGSFGGTRYMPLQILGHAAAASILGDYLLGGKLLVALATAGLTLLLFALLRSARCPAALALALSGAVLVTSTALWVSLGPRADVLPVLLQLGSIALVARSTHPRVLVIAAALAALAVTSKLSAVWAPPAAVIWLARRSPRAALLYSATFVALVGALFVVLELLSGGRMSDNVLGLAFSDADARTVTALLVEAPRKLVDELQSRADAVWPLVPIAVFGTALAFARRRATVYHVAFTLALLTLVTVLADEGADFYHLIDVVVLTALVVGLLAAELDGLGRRGAFVAAGLGLLIAWNVAASYQRELGPDTREALAMVVEGSDRSYARQPLRGRVDPNILSEDAYLPVSLGRDPVVLDSFMLARILRTHPDWQAQLVRRLDSREFDAVVLLYELDPSDYRYRQLHFGSDVATAILRNYRRTAVLEDYWRPLYVYEPLEGT